MIIIFIINIKETLLQRTMNEISENKNTVIKYMFHKQNTKICNKGS